MPLFSLVFSSPSYSSVAIKPFLFDIFLLKYFFYFEHHASEHSFVLKPNPVDSHHLTSKGVIIKFFTDYTVRSKYLIIVRFFKEVFLSNLRIGYVSNIYWKLLSGLKCT